MKETATTENYTLTQHDDLPIFCIFPLSFQRKQPKPTIEEVSPAILFMERAYSAVHCGNEETVFLVWRFPTQPEIDRQDTGTGG